MKRLFIIDCFCVNLFIIITILFSSCRKEIDVEIISTTQYLVVEGSIEPGFPPYVILTTSQNYFDSITNNTYQDLFIKDAEIKVWTTDIDGNTDTVNLTFLDDSIPYFIDVEYFNNPNNYGFSKAGQTYHLYIKWNSQIITSTTTIPSPTGLDSIWVEKNPNINADWWLESTSDIWSVYTDDHNTNNNILVKSKRLEHWINTNNGAINQSDNFLSLVDCLSDQIFNGESFKTAFLRPKQGFPPFGSYQSNRYEWNNSIQDSVYLPNDVVLIKFCQIDESSMMFWRSVMRTFTNNGNPFTEPMNLVSNINGGLGVWTGYGPVYYKVPIVQDTVIFNVYNPDIIDIY